MTGVTTGPATAPVRAEILALAALALFVVPSVLPYVLDQFELPLYPRTVAGIAVAAAVAIAWRGFWSSAGTAPGAVMALFVGTVMGVAIYLAWIASPAMLPPGSGPDLTHHLLLVDYLEREGTLVRDPNAAAALGEMATYTPGLHLLAVVTAATVGTAGFFTLYPLVAGSVALKIGLFVLIVHRLLAPVRARGAYALIAVAILLSLWPYTIGSFAHDSFLAQVLSELFAMAMFWALVVYTVHPSSWAATVFAVTAVACFLTWPMWVGPLVVALVLVMLPGQRAGVRTRLLHLLIALLPLMAVAALHLVGRMSALAIVGTSGAVAQPSVASVGWWLPPLAIAGLFLARRAPAGRALIALAVGLVAQTAALWLVARYSGAATPYMAIKMLYFAVYPLVASAALAASRLPLPPRAAWLAAFAITSAAGVQLARLDKPLPVVSRDLWEAGRWAREHLQADDVDYLVRDEYTAYWLHIAVLGNPRSATRSVDNDTYLTEPSFARWILENRGPRHAIARWSVLPHEIRTRTRVLQQFGDAAVITRSATD